MKKVLLIYPVSDPDAVDIPYDLLLIGTMLKQSGYAPVIVDSGVQPDYWERIEGNLPEAVCVVFSVITPHIGRALEISHRIKNISGSAPLVWIGLHPTFFSDTVTDPAVDIVCIGDPEFTMLDVVDAIASGRTLHHIHGISFKEHEGNVVTTDRRVPLDMDALPHIDYGLVDYELYRVRYLENSPSRGKKYRVHIFHSSRGCPHRCPYCINSHPDMGYRRYSLERFVDEIDSVVKQFDPEVIYFRDGSFFADRERTLGFLKVYKERNWRFRWIAMACVGYFREDYLSEDVLHEISPHVFRIGIGVESGAVDLRCAMNKRITDEQVLHVAEMLQRHNIFAIYFFMIGMPDESLADMVRTAKFILKLHRIAPHSISSLKIFQPHFAYGWQEELKKYGYAPPKTLDEWTSRATRGDGHELFLEDLDWVSNKPVIRYLRIAVSIATMSRDKIAGGDGSAVYKALKQLYYGFWKVSFALRIRFNCWSLLFELKLHALQDRLTE